MLSKTILVLSISFYDFSLLLTFFQINIHEGKSESFYPNKTDNEESGFIIGEIFSKMGSIIQIESKKFSPILQLDEKFNSSTIQSNGHQIMETQCTAHMNEEQDFLVHVSVNCTITENRNNTTSLPQDPDASTWLVGALSVLLLVILVQFVWLTHAKGQKTEPELKLPRIRSDQIKWEHLIGSGQYGEVWLGKLKLDTGEIIPVALKQPRNKQGRKYLLEEAICLSNLQHENILGVRGLCMHSLHSTSESELSPAFTKKAFQDFKYHPVLVFEYVNGGSCLDYLKAHHKKVRLSELRKIALDILEACIHMEEKHFVHRDIALRNILLHINRFPHSIGMAKLADFGLAKDISGDDLHLYENPNCEIPLRNTAPEGLSRGEFSTYSDVWSFGVLLWEMFTTWETGAQPVPYLDVQELMMVPHHVCELKKILPKPRLCPNKIYEELLKPCWKHVPQERPMFAVLKEILLEVWPDVRDSFPHSGSINERRIENSVQPPMKKKYVKRIVHQMKVVYNGIDRSHKTAMKKKSVDITKSATLKKKSGDYMKQSSITDSCLSSSDLDDSYNNLHEYQNVGKTNFAYVTNENETSNEDNHHNNLGYHDEEPATSTINCETPTAYGRICSNCGDVESANIDASIINAQQKLFDWIKINGAIMNTEKLKFNICSWIVNEEDSEINDQNMNSPLESRSNSFETDDIEEAKSDTNSSNDGCN